MKFKYFCYLFMNLWCNFGGQMSSLASREELKHTEKGVHGCRPLKAMVVLLSVSGHKLSRLKRC